MRWLNWLMGNENDEAERLRANTGKLADTLSEINDRLRESAGLPDLQTIHAPPVNRLNGRRSAAK